ncbi:mitochondrial ribosomal protein L37-domain-containing protein [Lasiosphaeria miniovina]|uniref:Large ribosomal subunit protein mL54 n=1 Tax=Lasiosphaeria miniovina TaxID=1954250 RepID=A0AA40DHV4_9PEZI|nr:mitochondrial ribosomal protein L37-domain-containing protein [Lasiosphaeria miniovina]KAK0703730.1 mitochondrial ribosomal protein L37-domain-containing protein [Lasiosphaeria miniovina]
MICRTCLRRAAGFSSSRPAIRLLTRSSISSSASTATSGLAPSVRGAFFTTTIRVRNAASATSSSSNSTATELTPVIPTSEEAAAAAATAAAEKPALSSCKAGTKLAGLNYLKGRNDPEALEDHEYPAWLWNCLEVQKKAATDEDADALDEFSKSRKVRRLAAKRQRTLEAKILASGDMEALAPKIPLVKQTINLLVGEGQGLPDALQAAEKREELRVAMRKDRKSKIKESNYLKTM